MFTRINSGGIWAVEGVLVSVEADVSDGLPGFSISGQLASEVRESQERVRTALKNSGFRLPAKKITVNLSPAAIERWYATHFVDSKRISQLKSDRGQREEQTNHTTGQS